jgi:hypothetical protein
MIFLSAVGLQLLFALFVFGAGHASALYVERRLGLPLLPWIERACLGAVIIVALLGMLGLAVVAAPHDARHFLAVLGLGVLALGSLWAIRRGGWRAARAAGASAQLYALGYLVLCVVSLALALWPARLPTVLVDGPYVAKHDLLGVRVQYTTGNLPTDNAIPHVVSEYLLRDISFKSERPIMPGQEVTNRPILAGLVLVPFRAAVRMPGAWVGPLPRFSYVGSSWPDFSVLMRDDKAYLVSQALGIALNALLLLAAGAFALRIAPTSPALSLAVIGLALSSPHILFQTYFTWPKSLAGFFVVVAWIASARLRSPAIAGLALGLAYLSHPYAIAYFAAYGLWYAWQTLRALPGEGHQFVQRLRQPVQQGLTLAIVFALIVLPWFAWSKWFLDIPSDLVSQNLIQVGQRWRDFFWVRPVNVLNTFLPVHLLGYPLDLRQMVRSSSVNVAGSVGLMIALAVAHRVCVTSAVRRSEIVLLWLLPVALLVLVFSNQAIPTVHGLQALVLVLIVAGAAHLWKRVGPGWAGLVLGAQVLLNVGLVVRYFRGLT